MSLTDPQTQQNSADIKELTISVTRVVTMVESSEKRHDGDMEVVKRLALGIEQMTEKMSILPMLNEKVTNTMASLQAQGERLERMSLKIESNTKDITNQGKQVATVETQVGALETWRNKLDGAGGAIKGIAYVLWAIFGTALVSGGYFLIQFCIEHAHIIQPITGE